MKQFEPEAEKILRERFGKDSVIALTTLDGTIPSVRYVNAYYEQSAFYVITDAMSGKMRQIAASRAVGIAGEWFTGHGIGVNLGWFGKPEHAVLAQKLRTAFADWIDNGHNDFQNENTVILKIELTDGILLSHGRRFEL